MLEKNFHKAALNVQVSLDSALAKENPLAQGPSLILGATYI